MAKEKKIVVTENQEVTAQEVIPVAPQSAEPVVDAPKTSDKKKKTSNSKKDSKPVVAKDKSEKPAEEPAESAPKQPSKKDKLIVVKKDKAEEKRRAAIAAEVKKLQAAGLAKEDIEMLIAAKFPPIDKVEPKKDEPKVSARDAMFPASFEVSGIKFTRLELQSSKIRDSVSKKDMESYINAIADARNNEPDNCQLCLAFQWSEDMLASTGSKGKGKSLYEKNTGITPPPKFPHDLDICVVTAFLPVQVEKITTYSLYTEFPGTVEFSVFHKRTREGWFDCFDAPCEVYLADFSEFDFSSGMFVDLYGDNNK